MLQQDDIIPQDLLVQILTFVATPSDLAHCAASCKALQKASNSPDLWRLMCEWRFGKEIATQTVVEEHYYGMDAWKQMMQDDCRKAALPTLQWWNEDTSSYEGKACFWTGNDIELQRCYCCWVECMKWDRVNGRILLFLDVRGEDDLRHPETRSFQLRTQSSSIIWGGRWVSEQQKEATGHYKGFLVISDSYFSGRRAKEGLFQFSYASNAPIFFDYEKMTLFEVKSTMELSEDYSKEQVLNCLFGLNRFPEEKAHYTLDVSPFGNDTPEIERKRWLKIFPAHVLDDTNRRSYRDGSGSTRRSWWA